MSKADQLMELLEQDLVVRIADQQSVSTADALSFFMRLKRIRSCTIRQPVCTWKAPTISMNCLEREQQAGR